MNFLAPAFFAGLAALAVPVLIHLIHRERRDVVAFPSLMFLRKIPYRTVRRQKIRHWLLLALRCLALILVVAAFARPFFAKRDVNGPVAAGAREVVVLLDRSYSMGYGTRWARAVAAARSAIDGIGPNDRATLVPFDAVAVPANAPTGERATLTGALAATKLGSGTTHYAPAIIAARKILTESKLPRREVVFISDFQKVAWDGHDDARLPPGTTLTRVDLSDKVTSNVAVTAVELARVYEEKREKVGVTARLTNKSAAARDLTVALDLGGRTMQTKKITLAPNNATTVVFDAFPLPDGVTRGTVHAAPDALAADDAFHFALARGQAIGVLLLEGSDASRSLYLSRALAIGGRPPFRITAKKLSQFSPSDLDGRALVILDDVGFPGGESGRRLAQWVRAGGGVFAILGDRATAGSWNAAGELFPGTVGTPTDLGAGRGGTLGYIDRSHPVFELFGAPRSGDFSAARVLRYRAIKLASDTGVIARFDDGAPALVEKKVGAGKVVIWTSTLDTYWNDLALQPVFLPFVHSLAKYTARYSEDQPWYTVGKVIDVRGLFAKDEPEVVVTKPSGTKVRLGAAGSARGIELDEQGFYDLRAEGESADDARVVAANLDASESDLSALDPDEFVAAVSAPPGAVVSGPGAPLTTAEREQQQRIWWYLLLLAFALLATETVMSNRLSRGRKLEARG